MVVFGVFSSFVRIVFEVSVHVYSCEPVKLKHLTGSECINDLVFCLRCHSGYEFPTISTVRLIVMKPRENRVSLNSFIFEGSTIYPISRKKSICPEVNCFSTHCRDKAQICSFLNEQLFLVCVSDDCSLQSLLPAVSLSPRCFKVKRTDLV